MSPGDRGDNGAVRVQAPPEGESQRQTTDAPVLPQIVVAGEHYGRLLRLLDKKIPVALEIDVKNRFVDTDLNSLNVIAELPGSDKADEVVMIGAHFDSWHSGTGATDNGVSSAVMIEAMRILKATGLQAAPHHPHGPVDRRGAGPARLARLRDASTSPIAPTWCSSRSTPSSPPTSTWTTAAAPSAASTCRATRRSRRSSRRG